MKSTTTIDICKLIAKAGGEAWLVGGCVRNAVHDTVDSASDEFLVVAHRHKMLRSKSQTINLYIDTMGVSHQISFSTIVRRHL